MTDNRTLLSLDLRFTECGDEAIFTISQIIFFNQKLKMYEKETDIEIKDAAPYIISDLRKAILHETTEDGAITSSEESSVVPLEYQMQEILKKEEQLPVA